MKQYVTDKHIRLIGKGWEVRRQLAAFMDIAGNDTLLRFTCLRTPVVAAIGRPADMGIRNE
ncbi:Z-ring formation inhibitor MciZ [Paenibacillus chungangensis]|uniref:Z-ring formation inhibitor MciZ n=1 Tax=Paenibacillus chungangensis TaxID=696535 RepID=A0ABW3HMT8_9BACL